MIRKNEQAYMEIQKRGARDGGREDGQVHTCGIRRMKTLPMRRSMRQTSQSRAW